VGPSAGLDRCGNLTPTEIRSPDRPARSQSLYRLSYRAPYLLYIFNIIPKYSLFYPKRRIQDINLNLIFLKFTVFCLVTVDIYSLKYFKKWLPDNRLYKPKSVACTWAINFVSYVYLCLTVSFVYLAKIHFILVRKFTVTLL
jgi:hypothetical protein